MSFERWPISVKGIVVVGDTVVMLRNERGEWELPGGRLEAGETPEECVAREIDEELDITVEVGDVVDVWVYPVLPDRSVVVITYGCLATEAVKPLISHEHNDVALIAVADLEQHPMPDGYRLSVRRWFTRQT